MTEAWSIALAVFVGGALGGALRHVVSTLAARHAGTRWPWGTLVVNVSGAFLAGLVVAAGALPPSAMTALLVTGALGGYTTVSSVALQTIQLAEGAGRGHAAGYLSSTLVLGILAAVGGLYVGTA